MKRFLTFALCILFKVCISSGQTFEREAKLDKANENGFNNILLTPDITSYLKEDLSDIRLYDADGEEIPYLLKSEVPQISQQLFREYNIIENKSITNCCTKLLLHNPEQSKINNISLIIRNSDVRKTAKLSGSDDKSNWYIIKDNYNLESIYNDTETSEVKILNFPLSDYQYYMLDIIDSSNAPLNIIKAGYYDTYCEDGKYLPISSASISQKDSSDKNSYVNITFSSAQYIDKLKIEINGPKYYLRNAQICTAFNEKGKTIYTGILNIQLRSNQENTFLLDHYHAKDLYLIIDNKDNQPLKIKEAKGYQLIHYLTANLDKEKQYYLRFGNKKISFPQYDLEYFKDSIPQQINVIKAGEITNTEETKNKPKESFFKSTIWIWSAILLIVILLGYMSAKMIKEIKKD